MGFNKFNEYCYEDWDVPELKTRTDAVKYVEEVIKPKLVGQIFTGATLLGTPYSCELAWENPADEAESVKIISQMDEIGTYEVLLFHFGETQLEIHFRSISRAKMGINTIGRDIYSVFEDDFPRRDITPIFKEAAGATVLDVVPIGLAGGFIFDRNSHPTVKKFVEYDVLFEVDILLDNGKVIYIYGMETDTFAGVCDLDCFYEALRNENIIQDVHLEFLD